MNSGRNQSRLLGFAFLFQAITSLASGMILLVLIVPADTNQSLINIAGHSWLMRANILGELITSIGVIVLGAILFTVLRRQNEVLALIALGCYLLEVSLGSVSRIPAFSVLRISQEFVTTGHAPYLQTAGKLALESMSFGYGLLMFPFCFGAILFYYLFYASRMIPRALSVWGLSSVSLALLGTLFTIAGYNVSFFIYLPYVPFEFVIGMWLLIKGLRMPLSWSDSL